MMLSVFFLSLASYTLGSSGQKGRNLIENGDFSTASGICEGASSCVSDNETWISPWIITSTSHAFKTRTSHPGTVKQKVYLGLNSDGPTTIGQNVATKIGATYRVKFSLNEDQCGPSVKSGFVSATGASPESFSHRGSHSKSIYYQFEAASSVTLIQIGSTTESTECGPLIDSISMILI